VKERAESSIYVGGRSSEKMRAEGVEEFYNAHYYPTGIEALKYFFRFLTLSLNYWI